MLKKICLAILDRFESYICQVLLVFFVCTLFLQIIMRALNQPLPWSEEISRYAFLWFILFGACYATRLCALNRVTFQLSKLPAWARHASLLLSDAIWIVFCLVMAWEGYLAYQDLAEFPYYTPALDWDLSKVYLVFPISFVLMAVRIVQVNFIKYVLKQEIADPDQIALEESAGVLMAEEEEKA
jgi:C4-dicarboxylate transporter DctQ subunit